MIGDFIPSIEHSDVPKKETEDSDYRDGKNNQKKNTELLTSSQLEVCTDFTIKHELDTSLMSSHEFEFLCFKEFYPHLQNNGSQKKS